MLGICSDALNVRPVLLGPSDARVIRIDEWTLRLVERFAADVETYPDEDRRVADLSQIVRDVETAGKVSPP
jgi:hypothetical protein